MTIDDYVPTNKNKVPIYGRCSSKNEMWVALVEKVSLFLFSVVVFD